MSETRSRESSVRTMIVHVTLSESRQMSTLQCQNANMSEPHVGSMSPKPASIEARVKQKQARVPGSRQEQLGLRVKPKGPCRLVSKAKNLVLARI